MRAVIGLAMVLVSVYIVILLVRLVLDWVQVLVRDWRPRGFALVIAEATYTVTDPPLRALRRVIPPLRLGSVRLDLGFMLLMLACFFVQGILQTVLARV